MPVYIATFFTHYDAMQFKRALDKLGGEGILCPVPRWLSSSCGTCLRFDTEQEQISRLPLADIERLVRLEGEQHSDIVDNR